MDDWTLPEMICAVGTLMGDLRGNWGYEYSSRMEEVETLLHKMGERDDLTEKQIMDVANDLRVTKEEMADPYDGRIFRDDCNFYEMEPEDGKTDRVKEYLLTVLTHPEYRWVGE